MIYQVTILKVTGHKSEKKVHRSITDWLKSTHSIWIFFEKNAATKELHDVWIKFSKKLVPTIYIAPDSRPTFTQYQSSVKNHLGILPGFFFARAITCSVLHHRYFLHWYFCWEKLFCGVVSEWNEWKKKSTIQLFESKSQFRTQFFSNEMEK